MPGKSDALLKHKKSRQGFELYLAKRALLIKGLRPAQGADAMCDFYRDVRAAANSDMLLYQWGTYDWGQGLNFELDITRQFIVGAGEDEDIWQLQLTFRLAPSGDLGALGKGDRWCKTPVDLDAFSEFVRTSAAYLAVGTRDDAVVSLDYECAG
jgi:hypothetical protein